MQSGFSGLLLLCLLYVSSAFAATRQFTLNLGYARLAPDGYSMDMMLANGQLDYPIVVNKGDTVAVTVVNNMNVSTAIHWHGMYQKGTPWMDGSSMVTQCPIGPGDTYVYQFNVGNQYINGLRGPFIINDPQDPYKSKYDYDLTITLSDFFHNGSEVLKKSFFNEENTLAYEPIPDAGLIGGVGQFNCAYTKNKNCKNSNPLKRYNIAPGKRYRLRLINTAAQAHYNFSIDGHDLTVIEADGAYTNPTIVNEISIHSAQRYSVILTAKATVNNYWIRAVMYDTWGPEFIVNGLNMDVRAILSYSGASTTALPKTQKQLIINPLDPWLVGELNGLTSNDLPDFWSYNQTFYMSFAYGPPFYTYPLATVSLDNENQHFRDSQYVMPIIGKEPPTLSSLISNKSAEFPASINPIYVHNNQWVFMMVRNQDAMEHPFHLHGHSFYVINYGNLRHQTTTPPTTLSRRDTIQVPACTGGTGQGGENGCMHGFVNIAIKFDNPGAWLFHCHIEWHMAAGMIVTFINKGDDGRNPLPDLTKTPDAIPWQAFDTC
ncbi:Cupredoxin [Obelidium mucronatum]|nr:Cupredoxin [Obelidium mucronatum]